MLSTTTQTRAQYDRTLVARFVESGDEAAFVEIVQYYRPRILLNVSRWLANKCDAEEVQADTFIRAYKGLEHFRNESSLYTWLCRIAINLARNRYAYNMRRREDRKLSLDSSYAPDSHSTFHNFIVDENQKHVADVIDLQSKEEKIMACTRRLTAQQRLIFNLYVNERLPYAEIALRVGICEGTVKSRLARARANIKRQIAA